MARAYCHKIIKLSAVIQSLAPEKETVCNVHGVREKFLEVGQEYAHKVGGGGRESLLGLVVAVVWVLAGRRRRRCCSVLMVLVLDPVV